MMESPETASEMACPMVLQAVVGDLQLLLLLPLTPFTYHVVADAIGTHRANSNAVVSLCFMIVSSSFTLGRCDASLRLYWRGVFL